MSKKNKLKNTVDEYFYNLINDVNKDVSIAHIGDYKFYPHLSTKNCIYINKHLNFARFRYFSSAYLGWGKTPQQSSLPKKLKTEEYPSS